MTRMPFWFFAIFVAVPISIIVTFVVVFLYDRLKRLKREFDEFDATIKERREERKKREQKMMEDIERLSAENALLKAALETKVALEKKEAEYEEFSAQIKSRMDSTRKRMGL